MILTSPLKYAMVGFNCIWVRTSLSCLKFRNNKCPHEILQGFQKYKSQEALKTAN